MNATRAVLEPAARQPETVDWRAQGLSAAQAAHESAPGKRVRGIDRRSLRNLLYGAARSVSPDQYAWLSENWRLVQTAETETRGLAAHLHRYPHVRNIDGSAVARVRLLAIEYLTRSNNEFTEESLIAFLEGFQEQAPLNLGEVWAMRPCLQWELVERLMGGPAADWPGLITSLRRVGETSWRDVLEAVSCVDRTLAQDPAGAYLSMDYESRDRYRYTVGQFSEHSSLSELEIAEAAIALCRSAREKSDGSRASVRRTHVGYYLLDKGRPELEAAIRYRPPVRHVVARFLLRHPTGAYLSVVELLTLALVFAMLSGLSTRTPIFAAMVLLLLPATQAAVAFLNTLVTALLEPRALPKLDFSSGIPAECQTLVAVPALLLNEQQVHDLVLDLEIRFLANRDPNLYFALLTDSPDSDRPVDQRDALVDVCRRLIEGLNRRYETGRRPPFLLLHRHRAYNESEGRWMGWERKRGKLLDLNRLLRDSFDAFPIKSGDLTVLAQTRYVITLDADTQLPRDAAARLAGTLAHPLNQAVVDPESRMVVEGYGILQPRVGISIQSTARSRLARLYSGQTGFDIYTRAISDVYQDLFGEGIFAGKGIYEVDVLRATLEGRFPANALLSHDLIEGAYARAGLVSDIELIDDYPSHFSSYCRRKHRWVRGDWQILRWVLARVPDARARMIRNPISGISRWKIVDNLRRSLFEPSLLLLLVAGWLFLPASPLYWTLAAVAVLLIPAYTGLLVALLRAPHNRLSVWLRETAHAFAEGNVTAIFSLIFLLHQSLLALDAILRSLGRVFVTRHRLLEWETAAEAEGSMRSKATVDTYLEWTPCVAVALGVAVRLIRPSAFPVAAPILFLWLISRGVSTWLNRRPRTGHCRLNQEDTRLLRDSAERIYRYFHDWSTPATRWLVPDSVHEDAAADLRISPTNLGLLLNTRIAAVHLGLKPLAEFVFETAQTLETVAALPKHRGHLFNWYDVASLEPLEPQFVSTVDSGNLAAALWTLKQAALTFAAEPPGKRGLTPELASDLERVAESADAMVRDMDFRFLYNRRRKSLSVGFDVRANRRDASCYDLLASEARSAAFVAIAKGDVPQETWFRLGRAHTLAYGERLLLSWTGTMFEYLMPAIWMRHYPGTITEQSARAAVRVQREYGRRKGVPWGISESACLSSAGEAFGYAPFGVPQLALKGGRPRLVIAPYASFLSLAIEPGVVLQNLRRIQEFGWEGRYGFYEAIEYTSTGGEPVRVWMAHHQAMSLLAITNLLFDNILQQYFHSEPQVLATELLLDERVPRSALTEAEFLPVAEIFPATA